MTKPTLLLVDDSPDVAAIIRLLGKRAGVDVLVRSGVADGWAALQEQRPDLVLVDMRLIGESGAKFCRMVREQPEWSGLRIALFTSWSMPDDIRAGFEAGADLLFPKDYVTQSVEWQRRLMEILAWKHGRVWEKLLALKSYLAWPAPPPNWITVYNSALQQTLARRCDADLLRFVLLQAVRQALIWQQRQDDPAAWLTPDGMGLTRKQIPSASEPETAAALGASLAEQVWCLLGSRDSALFATALAPIVPGLTEALLL